MDRVWQAFVAFENRKVRLFSRGAPASDPQQWPTTTKLWVSFVVCLNTAIVYMGASIYTPAVSGVMDQFGVSSTAALLPFALYVLAYGAGPLVFTPLSEIPAVGRNPLYMVAFLLFTVLCIPTALADSLATLCVLRFLGGFLGSNVLATGGATLQDLFPQHKVPYAICAWATACWAGPSVGPLLAGLTVPLAGWRWSLWELAILAAPTLILVLLAQPETNPETLARRLSPTAHDDDKRSHPSAWNVVQRATIDCIYRPWRLLLLDPSLLYMDVYMALCYGIYYSFFEVFPIVFSDRYGFSPQGLALVYLCVPVAVFFGHSTFALYHRGAHEARIHGEAKPEVAPEERLNIACYTSPLLPAGLFLFAWTSRPPIHWAVPLIGVVMYICSAYCLFQAILTYLPLNYPRHAGVGSACWVA
ncbi:unnamed protein product [Parajaminaea phylloscopi]